MAHHNTLGIDGELLACTKMNEQGYKILKKNWRHKRDEIDLIIQKEGVIAFVEVKTRANRYAGPPEKHVTISKQKRIIRAAQAYVEAFDVEEELRFDIIAIVLNSKEKHINHIENAFYPQ
ncbi:MAG: putative endonuclease [Patiriisocius sp.]